MRSVFYLTLSAIATLAAAAADKANPFNIPPEGYSFKTGEPTTLTWAPTTSGTVTLRLQWGGVLTPNSGTAIAKSIPNSGSYTWTPPSNLASQPDYTVEIVSDDNTSEVNYLPRFVVAGAAESTKTSTSTAASATTTEAASTTTSSVEKTTSTSSPSKTETPTTLSTATSTGSSSSSSSSSTSTGTGSGGKGSATSTSSSTGSSSAAASSTSAQASSTNTPSASASETSVPNSNAGTTTRVSGAMMALVLAGVAVF